MNLEERYNAAGADTYVGRVRLQQSAEAGAGAGVNFVDGDARGIWSPDSTAAPDQVQAEFTRNESGDYRYGGGDKNPAGTNDKSYPLSRWLSRGLEKAFGADGYFTNNRFTTVNDVRNAGTLVHKYAPLGGKQFDEATILSELSKGKISGSPIGPSPAGLGG
jgi:hypothetical protein